MTNTKAISTTQAVCCPKCNSKGKKVQRITLESLLNADASIRIGEEQYRFCGEIDCEIVYFGSNATIFSKIDLSVRIGVKERKSPRHVCYCFDHTIEEIETEVRETGQSTVLENIKTRMKTACWCETKNPQGSCCLGIVGKYVKQAMVAHGYNLRAQEIPDEQADCCAAGSHEQSLTESEEIVMQEYCSNTDTNATTKGKGQRAGMLAVGGSMFSALIASACCWIPLLLILFGMSVGGVSAWFEQYRWLFLGISALLLVTGFYFVYFRKQECVSGTACAMPNQRLLRFNRITLWVATVVVIATAAFPNYAGYLIPKEEPAQITIPVDQVVNASLGIEGMTCDACAVLVNNALVKVPGILDVDVSYSDGNATISFDATKPPSVTELVSAVEGAGYKVDTSAMNR